MLLSLYSCFVLIAQAVRHVLLGDPSHFKMLRKFYVLFHDLFALPHSYVLICVFFHFLYLFYNFMNITGVNDAEYIC